MGLLDKLFGASERSEERRLPWVPLEESKQLEELDSRSYDRPQLIYKHSTTCGISSMVLGMFSRSYSLEDDQMDLHFLDIHYSRPLSNEIATRYGVRHESPQLILVREGQAVLNRSHGSIAHLDIGDYI